MNIRSCRSHDKTVVAALLLGFICTSGPALAAPPSFDCAKAGTSIEQLVCADPDLAALDRTMAETYAAATARAADEQPPLLAAEQRGWIKGRNDCWKSADPRHCAADSYRLRIAELQARYRLVPASGEARYVCDDDPHSEIFASYFPTDPPILVAERGDQVALMTLQRSASGARYQGRNESLWEHQGEAQVTWGYGSAPMRCVKADGPAGHPAPKPVATASAEGPELAAFPPAATGMTRFVIVLPEPERSAEGAFQVELVAGREIFTDGVNLVRLNSTLEPRIVEGWGYPYYQAVGSGLVASTLMAPPEGRPPVKTFVMGEPLLVRYNSRLPIVVYAPEDYQVRYRVWSAPAAFGKAEQR